MKYKITYNPNWAHKNKNTCCYFCGETRSVKYVVDLYNPYGSRALTVDCCNRCALMLDTDKNTGE